MPIHYDITTDGLYLEGMEKGMEKGIHQTEEKHENKKKNAIKMMIQDGMSIKSIARYLEVTQKYVKQIQKELETN